MSEVKTTALFAAAAAISLGLAWTFRPTAVLSEGQLAEEKRGSAIFPELDPTTAQSFRIVKFDEQLATLSRIELAKDPKTELWTLPSADGYPADSEQQVSQATTPLVALNVIQTVSTDRGDHVLYGVVEPNEQELTASASGVGILVQVGGADSQILASLIIGKEVQGSKGQHYVRVPSEDAVYIVEISTDAFSTEFSKWIKGDILNVVSSNIEFVGLRDHAIVRTDRAFGLARNFDCDLENKDSRWSLKSFIDYTVEGQPTMTEPPPGTKLNEETLNALRTSIQNLKIVNVRRKPLGLAADLKADKSLMENVESARSLQDQGFFPLESGDVFSSGGEVILGTKEGIRYFLRFGNTQVSGSSLSAEEEAEGAEDKADSDEGVRRYLLVMAQLDESKFPAPDLKLVPETVQQMLEMEAAEKAETAVPPAAAPSTADVQVSESSADDAPATDDATSVDTPAQELPASEGSPADAPATESQDGEAAPQADQPPSAKNVRPIHSRLVSFTNDEAGSSPDDAASNPSDAQPSDNAVPEQELSTTPASSKAGQTELAPSAEPTAEELQEQLQFMQETIRKENQRLIDSRNESLNETRKKVAELNARFADWYYIVSDSVYQKLKVSREQLFQTPEQAAKAAQGAGSQFPGLPSDISLPPE
ncbi:MAG: DUF4340 domain-containing protein [Pirellulaceae bacterium]|nr:DUF4340 domain-containing protein [Pirellulaceae bacterium]